MKTGNVNGHSDSAALLHHCALEAVFQVYTSKSSLEGILAEYNIMSHNLFFVSHYLTDSPSITKFLSS